MGLASLFASSGLLGDGTSVRLAVGEDRLGREDWRVRWPILLRFVFRNAIIVVDRPRVATTLRYVEPGS